jgi:hypothetical protein
MAITALAQTTSGRTYRAARAAAVTSPHSEKKIAAKETAAAFEVR